MIIILVFACSLFCFHVNADNYILVPRTVFNGYEQDNGVAAAALATVQPNVVKIVPRPVPDALRRPTPIPGDVDYLIVPRPDYANKLGANYYGSVGLPKKVELVQQADRSAGERREVSDQASASQGRQRQQASNFNSQAAEHRGVQQANGHMLNDASILMANERTSGAADESQANLSGRNAYANTQGSQDSQGSYGRAASYQPRYYEQNNNNYDNSARFYPVNNRRQQQQQPYYDNTNNKRPLYWRPTPYQQQPYYQQDNSRFAARNIPAPYFADFGNVGSYDDGRGYYGIPTTVEKPFTTQGSSPSCCNNRLPTPDGFDKFLVF